jgi:hypothetical protein
MRSATGHIVSLSWDDEVTQCGAEPSTVYRLFVRIGRVAQAVAEEVEGSTTSITGTTGSSSQG